MFTPTMYTLLVVLSIIIASLSFYLATVRLLSLLLIEVNSEQKDKGAAIKVIGFGYAGVLFMVLSLSFM